MSDTLVYALGYNMMILCWLQECGILPPGSDLLFIEEDPGFIERVEASGRFGNVFQVGKANSRGRSYSLREQMVGHVLQNPGRAYRSKRAYFELLNAGRFFGKGGSGYKTIFVPEPFFMENRHGLLSYLATNPDASLMVWEHGATLAQIATVRFFSRHFTGANSLAMGLLGVAQPSRYVKAFHLFRPELVESTARLGMDVRRVPSMRDCPDFISDMNRLFANTGEKRVLYENHKCLLLPASKERSVTQQRRRMKFLDACAAVLGRQSIMVKPHPGSTEEEIAAFGGYALFREKSLPFELSFANLSDPDERLILAENTSIAALSPKMFFDAEPYVLILDRVFPFVNSVGDFSELMSLREGVRSLYGKPEKFLIAETEDEALEFVKNFRRENGLRFQPGR